MQSLAPSPITGDSIRRSLEALNNPHQLARSPLVALKSVQVVSNQLSEKAPLKFGVALRQVLLEAVEQLNPCSVQPVESIPNLVQSSTLSVASPQTYLDPAWQPYVILTHRFVANNRYSRYENIASKLAVSKSTYYRKLDNAIALLGNILERIEADTEVAIKVDIQVDANTDLTTNATPTMEAANELLAIPPVPNYEYFIGRDDLITCIKQTLSTHHRHHQPANLQTPVPMPTTIGLWGLPGSGKTTLLIQLANDPELRDLFPDGVLWGSLGCAPNLAALTHAWCMAMRVPSARLNQAVSVADRIKLLHEAIAQRRVLIIVDDVWNTSDALPLKVRGPNTTLLFTSRFPEVAAALAGPNTFKVGELTDAHSLDMLTAYAPFAVQCFPQHAQSLAVMLGGLPLALVIAGQFLQQASFAQQPRRIQQAFDRLDDAAFRLTLSDSSVKVQGDEPSHRTLSAVLAQSIHMLSPQAQRTLQYLSLLPQQPNTFFEDAALAIAETESVSDRTGPVSGRTVPVSDHTGHDSLDELVNMGLLDVALGDERYRHMSRYTLHQLISDFASAHCDHHQRENIQRRITRYYANQLKLLEPPDAPSRIEFTNCLAAAQLAQKCNHESESIQLSLGLYPYLEAWGLWNIAASLLSPLLSYSQIRRSTADHADVLLKLAHCHRLQKHLAQAEAFTQSAESLISPFDATNLLNHAEIASRAHELQANILMDKGQHRAAIQRCTRALEAALEARSPNLAEQARHTLALAFSLSGDYDQMVETLDALPSNKPSSLSTFEPSKLSWLNRAVVSIGRKTHLYQCQAHALQAVALFLQAKLPEAADQARTALEIARNAHNRRWIVLSLEWLGWILNTLGQYDEVLNLMSEVFSLRHKQEGDHTGPVGNPTVKDFKEDLTFLYANLGLVAKARGALDEAEAHLSNALAIASQIPVGHMNGKTTLYTTQARIQLAHGKLDQAEHDTHRSIAVADNNIELIPAFALMGYLKARRGQAQESDQYFAKALGQGKRLGLINHTMLIQFATHYRAESALVLGRYDQAITDFTAARAIAERARSSESLGITTFGLARACAAAGHLDEARRHLGTSLSHLQAIGHVYAQAAQDIAQQIKQGELLSFSTPYGF